MIDLSVLIPARNEQFLSMTVETMLKNIRANTEILVGLDGEWADPPLPDDPRVTVVFRNESIGQRAMTNELCKLARGKYVMKIDAHCSVDEGFDKKMVDGFKEVGDNVTMIPALYNLHVFNWRCKKCGNEWYQSPTPNHCQLPGENKGINESCDSQEFEKKIYWEPRKSRRSEAYRFDTSLHFQYHREQMKKAKGDFVETMSAQGSCFMLTREKYWELNISEEEFGSWGQQGTEVACKTWLSGGRLLTNRRTWYAHLFRTQGGDFGFPFPLSQKQVDHARAYSKELFLENKWPLQIRPLSWLLEKFKPVPQWHDPEGAKMLSFVMKEGEKYNKQRHTKSKGIIYYTTNEVPLKIARSVQKRIKSVGLPIVSASLKPMDFGKNIYIPKKKGWITMNEQILACLNASKADFVFFTEHDCLYPKEHFDFTPPRDDTYYYNVNVWKVRDDGFAVKVDDCRQLSGLVCSRELAIKHYTKRLKMLQDGFDVRKIGFEPGTHNRTEKVDSNVSETFSSKVPIIDIRHKDNATKTKWTPEEFRNEKFAHGWKESTIDAISGWRREDFPF